MSIQTLRSHKRLTGARATRRQQIWFSRKSEMAVEIARWRECDAGDIR